MTITYGLTWLILFYVLLFGVFVIQAEASPGQTPFNLSFTPKLPRRDTGVQRSHYKFNAFPNQGELQPLTEQIITPFYDAHADICGVLSTVSGIAVNTIHTTYTTTCSTYHTLHHLNKDFHHLLEPLPIIISAHQKQGESQHISSFDHLLPSPETTEATFTISELYMPILHHMHYLSMRTTMYNPELMCCVNQVLNWINPMYYIIGVSLYLCLLFTIFGIDLLVEPIPKHNNEETPGHQPTYRFKTRQRHEYVPKRYKFAPGLPKRFYVFSMLTLSKKFDTYISKGYLKPKPAPLRYSNKIYIKRRFIDPTLEPWANKEYELARINACVKGGTPVGSFKQFMKELNSRVDEPTRIRLLAKPRPHSIRRNSFTQPDPPLYSRNKYELFEPRAWLQGEWESDWNVMDTVASSPALFTRLNNFAQDLPSDACFGNLRTRISEALNIRDQPIIYETNLQRSIGIYNTTIPDEEWLVNLRSQIDKKETQLRGLIIDTGASTCATPFKEDFIGPIHFKDLGEVQTSDKSTKISIMGSGIIRYRAVDALGNICYLECLAYYIPDMKEALFSPQSYCQFHKLDKAEAYYGGNATSFWMQSNSGHTLRFPLHGGSNLPILLVKPDSSQCDCCNHKPPKEELQQRSSSPTTSTFNPNFLSEWLYSQVCCRQTTAQLHQSVFADDNDNLDAARKEWLLIHHRVGHIGAEHLTTLMKRCMPVDLKDYSKSDKLPKCVPCLKTKKHNTPYVDKVECAACNYGKMHKRGDGSRQTRQVQDKVDSVKGKDLKPGDKVSMDQYVCPVRGRLPFKRGRERETLKYGGGTIFVDHASGFIFLVHQVSFSADETIKAKRLFEQELQNFDIKVKHYHTDNGVFKAEAFTNAIEEDGQKITFSGVGAHHQNGVSERGIRTVVDKARTLMIHASMHWPEAFKMDLWPFAMDYAALLYNNTPGLKSGRAPIEKLTGVRFNCQILSRAKVWGCPAFVLSAKLQDSKKIPKFQPRARLGQFLGFSTQHSSLIGNIRNLQTGHVSPQWHVAYDELFETTTSAGRNEEELEAIWNEMFREHRDYYADDASTRQEDEPPDLADDWLTDDELQARQRIRRNRRQRRGERNQQPDQANQRADADDDANDDNDNNDLQNDHDDDDNSSSHDDDSDSDDDSGPPASRLRSSNPRSRQEQRDRQELRDEVTTRNAIPSGPSRRSSRRNETPTRVLPRRRSRGRREPTFAEEFQQPAAQCSRSINSLRLPKRFTDKYSLLTRTPSTKAMAFRSIMLRCSSDIMLMNLDWASRATTYRSQDMERSERSATDPFTGEIHYWHPMTLASKANTEDYPTFREILNMDEEDRKAWFEAMDKEMDGLKDMGTYDVVPRDEALKAGQQIVPTTWANRVKRNPAGDETRKKARCVLRGDLQDSRQISSRNDIYTPLVDWATVRLLFGLTVHEGLKTRQVDFRLAFMQSPLKDPLFAEFPPGGWKQANPGMIMKFNRSIYGDRRSPQMWYKHLKKGLEARGWKASTLDPCLYLRNDVIFTCYCDDGIFFAKDDKAIDDAVKSLQTEIHDPETNDLVEGGWAFDLEYESDFAGYLGIELRRTPDGALHMTQLALTKRIIAALNLENANPKATPASGPLLRRLDSAPREEEWNYRSVVGMMQFLSNNSRNDLAFAVNQVARYGNNPRKVHEQAVKRIGKYLKGTLYTDENGVERVQGTIFRQTEEDKKKKLQLDLYADADFAGTWNAEEQHDPDTARSRTGYVALLGGLPIIWKSQLQVGTALSTAEAEMGALSAGMRALVPLRHIFFEICDNFNIPAKRVSLISHAYEDNEATLHVATADPPRLTARNKHWNVKHHWFRSHLKEGDHAILILPIASEDQLADIYTKALTEALFVKCRKKLMGW